MGWGDDDEVLQPAPAAGADWGTDDEILAHPFQARATGYHPVSPGSVDYRMEGGFQDRKGAPIYTLDQFQRGEAPYVTVAGDTSAFPYGTELTSPQFPGVPFRWNDTGGAFKGKGTSRVDIARDTAAGANSDLNNGAVTFTPTPSPSSSAAGPADGKTSVAAPIPGFLEKVKGVLKDDAVYMAGGLSDLHDRLKAASDYVAPGFFDQATTSPLHTEPLRPAKDDSKATQVGKAAYNVTTNLLEGLTSPAMVATGAAATIPALTRAVSGAFAGDVAANLPAQYEAVRNAPAGSQEQIESGLNLAASIAMLKATSDHAIGERPAAAAAPAPAELAVGEEPAEPPPATAQDSTPGWQAPETDEVVAGPAAPVTTAPPAEAGEASVPPAVSVGVPDVQTASPADIPALPEATPETVAENPETTVATAPAEASEWTSPTEDPIVQPPPEQVEPTGIRNAIVDPQRIDRGIDERVAPLRKTFGESWNQALQQVVADPAAGNTLVDELSAKARPLTDVESALLSHETVRRESAHDAAVDAVNNAPDDASRSSAQAQLAVARDAVHKLYEAGQNAGTETARGLAARKLLVNQDYTLARMEATKRAVANGGKLLSDSQLSEVAAAHQEIARLKQKVDDYEARNRDTETAQYFQKLVTQTRREARASARSGGNLTTFLDREALKAKQRIVARRGQLRVTVDPLNVGGLVDEAIIGAAHLARGLNKFSDWSRAMITDFGERIRPHLGDLFDRAKAYHDVHALAFKDPGNVKRDLLLSRAQASPRETALPDSRFIYELARSHVQRGVQGMEGVMKAVHRDTEPLYPGLTERNVRDAFSDYGKVNFPSKEADLVALREYRRQAQLVSALEDAQSGVSPKRTGMQRDRPSERVNFLRQQVQDAMRESGIEREPLDPADVLKTPLDRYKTYLKNRTRDLELNISRNEYVRKTRSTTELDGEALKLKADYQRARDKFDAGLERDRLAKRTASEKVLDTFAQWRRAFLLSSPLTIAKLASAAAERVAITPIEEAIGAGLSKIPGISQVARRAPREGGGSIRAEARALTEGFTKGMADAARTLRSGRSDLEVALGKRELIPRSAIEFIGSIHGALKTPAKRNEFARSFEKRTNHAIRQGLDPTDPIVQTSIATKAYKDANRAIFMQDNRVVNGWKSFLATLEARDKITGHATLGGKVGATVANILLPIVKVPSNIVAETFQYTFGIVTGSVRLAKAFREGIEKLHPDEADLIMRSLKKGSLGAAVLTLGYLNPHTFGGYYQAGEKRKPSDVKPGTARIYGHEIPTYLLHNPLLEQFQLGATIRRVADSKLRKSDHASQGLTNGVKAAVLGVTEEVPFVKDTLDLGKLYDAHQRGSIEGQYAESIIVPQVSQFLATRTDTNSLGQPIKRAPQSLVQYLESGIPGLRERVPIKKKRR